MSYHLSQLGWDEHFASRYRRFDRADATPGRVLRTDRGVCTVLTTDGVPRSVVPRRETVRRSSPEATRLRDLGRRLRDRVVR